MDLKETDIPLLFKEGWTRPQENIAKPPLWERTGWLVQTTANRWLEPTFLKAARYRACASRPSARANVASRNLLDRAAALLIQAGEFALLSDVPG